MRLPVMLASLERRPLDRRAYVIITFAWLAALALLLLRAWATDQVDDGFLALADDAQNRVWVVSKDRLLVANSEGELVESALLGDLRVSGLVRDAIPFKSGIGIVTKDGLFGCTAQPVLCRPQALAVAVQEGKAAYSAERDELLMVDNERDVVYLLDAQTGALKSTSNRATTRLSSPNKPVFADGWLVLANSGRYELLGWPLQRDEPLDLGVAATRLLKTRAQPYFAVPLTGDEWLVLESGSILIGGKVNRYHKGGFQNQLATGVDDPVALVRTTQGQGLLPGSLGSSVKSFRDGESAREFFKPSALAVLDTHFKHGKFLASLSLWAGMAMVVMIFLPLLLLGLLGYNLNQALGTKGGTSR